MIKCKWFSSCFFILLFLSNTLLNIMHRCNYFAYLRNLVFFWDSIVLLWFLLFSCLKSKTFWRMFNRLDCLLGYLWACKWITGIQQMIGTFVIKAIHFFNNALCTLHIITESICGTLFGLIISCFLNSFCDDEWAISNNFRSPSESSSCDFFGIWCVFFQCLCIFDFR